MPQNMEAWEHWGVLNTFDRPPANGFGGIPTINSKTVRDYCRDFNFTEFDYKKILAVEQIFKTAMQEKQEKKAKAEEDKNDFLKKNKKPMPKKRR